MLLAMIRVSSELQASDLLMAPAEIPPRLCVRRVRRDERLAARCDNPADQAKKDKRRGGQGHFVATNKFRGAIAKRVLAREHRPVFEMPPNVFRELLDRLVAALRFLAQRH